MSITIEKFTKLKKAISIGGKVLSWIIAIASFILAIITLCLPQNNEENAIEWATGIIISIVIFNSLFLLLAGVYECVLYFKGKAIAESNKKDLNDLKSKLEKSKNFSLSFASFSFTLFEKYNSAKNKTIDSAGSFFEQLPNFAEALKKDEANQQVQALLISSERNFRDSIIVNYDKYLRFFTDEIKNMIDKSLDQKGLKLSCSVSIKQFDKIYEDNMDYRDLKVYTTFRDGSTFNDKIKKGKREVCSKIFSVSKNIDFVQCLSQESFLKNNFNQSDTDYYNESVEYFKNYNCAMVVPIFSIYGGRKRYYGYLACDTLNTDLENSNIFDEEMLQIMKFSTNILGSYFDDLDYQWDNLQESLEKYLEENISSDFLYTQIEADEFLTVLYELKTKNREIESERMVI